jgi:hypothetical protein
MSKRSDGTLPVWAIEPPFDPARDWVPVVCTGGAGALVHPLALIGIYFEVRGEESDARREYHYRGAPIDGTQGDRYIVTTFVDAQGNSATRVPAVDEVGASALRLASLAHAVVSRNRSGGDGSAGSVETSCPSCRRTHRIGLRNWDDQLAMYLGLRAKGRISFAFVDVNDLDTPH